MYNVPDPEVLIHHERRIIEIDSNFAGSNASFSFHVIGEDSTEKKIFIESIDEYRAVIKDTSQTSGKTQVRVSNNGLLSYVGEKWILVSKIFSVEAENGNLLKNGLVGHPFELSIVNVDSLRINGIDQMDEQGFVTISTSPRVLIYEKNSELGFDLWGDFAKVSGRRVMQKTWGEYKEMLSGKSLLYFYTDRGGLHDIDINLSWPSSITRNVSSNTSESPVNSYIAENITFNMKFDNIVLEPVTNEIVSGNLAEVYNPSVVVLNETASFKIEVSGVESEMVSWRSENEKVKFLDGSIESDIGIGKTVKVKGNSLGEDKLIIDIAGYDGRSPEISFDVLNWKNINVYTCNVKNEDGDSVFTDSDIEEAIDKGNEIFKQIGVKMIRVPYVNALANKEKYRILTDVETMKELINIKRNTIDGVEIYFVAGQTFDDNMIAEAYYDKGIVITKYGRIREGEPLKIRFSPYILAHEVLHCMRTDASGGQCVFDIYDYGIDIWGNEIYFPDNRHVGESDIPLDWGTGYYRAKTILTDIHKRLLMFGIKSNGLYDIPRGSVWGGNKDGIITNVNCGGIVDLKDRSFRNDN